MQRAGLKFVVMKSPLGAAGQLCNAFLFFNGAMRSPPQLLWALRTASVPFMRVGLLTCTGGSAINLI